MAEATRGHTEQPRDDGGKRPDQASHPEPKGMADGDRPAVREPGEARQAEPIRGGLIRRVMVISIVLVAAAFALLYLLYFGAPGE